VQRVKVSLAASDDISAARECHNNIAVGTVLIMCIGLRRTVFHRPITPVNSIFRYVPQAPPATVHI